MIPTTAHFIWFGHELSWAHALSVRTALANGGFHKVVLHHDRPLSGAGFEALPQESRLELRLIDWEALVAQLPSQYKGLVAIADNLGAPAAKANVLRATILAAEGGVYLDTDMITLRSFAPLCREASVFYGTETVAFPSEVVQGRSVPRKALAYAGSAARELFRRWPSGWKGFRWIEPLYPQAANNAVLASEPGHPFVLEMLRRMLAIDESRLRVRYALGTHLLQQVAKETWPSDVIKCPPSRFYPLGPEISEHWFRINKKTAPALHEVLSPDTLAVHWYASVRTKSIVPQINEEYVRAHEHEQLFSALIRRALQAG